MPSKYYHVCPKCGHEEFCITQWAKVPAYYKHICSKCGHHFKAERKKKELLFNGKVIWVIAGNPRGGMSAYLEQVAQEYLENGGMIDLLGGPEDSFGLCKWRASDNA